MLTFLAKLLKALNSESAPWQIALAFSFALIVGFTPWLSMHNLVVLILVFSLRVNLTAFFLGVAVVSGLAWLLDPYLSSVGEALLTKPEWQEFWTHLYQQDVWRILAFNHTLVLGGLTVAFVLFLPVFWIIRALIVVYRERLLAWVNKFKVVHMLKASKFYRLYQAVAE